MKSIVFFKYVLTILFALYVTYVRADFTAKVQRVVDANPYGWFCSGASIPVNLTLNFLPASSLT